MCKAPQSRPPREGARIRCIAGKNACPPEDVGGSTAYFDFLTAIKDLVHEEHFGMLQWVGGSFDPNAFNITDVNERLSAIEA